MPDRTNTRLPVEEMGRREYPLVDEQVQAPPDQVGEEKEELPGDDTLRLRMDHIPADRNIRISSVRNLENLRKAECS